MNSGPRRCLSAPREQSGRPRGRPTRNPMGGGASRGFLSAPILTAKVLADALGVKTAAALAGANRHWRCHRGQVALQGGRRCPGAQPEPDQGLRARTERRAAVGPHRRITPGPWGGPHRLRGVSAADLRPCPGGRRMSATRPPAAKPRLRNGIIRRGSTWSYVIRVTDQRGVEETPNALAVLDRQRRPSERATPHGPGQAVESSSTGTR